MNGHFWLNLCLNCIFKWTWFVKTDLWSVIEGSRLRFPIAAAIICLSSPFFSHLWLSSPSVPLEFPKLANAQPSNFGPLRIYILNFRPLKIYLPYCRHSVKSEMLWVLMIFACIPYLTVICLLWKCSSKKLGSYQVPVGCQARKCLDFSQLLYIMF